MNKFVPIAYKDIEINCCGRTTIMKSVLHPCQKVWDNSGKSSFYSKDLTLSAGDTLLPVCCGFCGARRMLVIQVDRSYKGPIL